MKTITKATHTPGPWRVGDAGRTVFGPKTDSPSPKTIATVSTATFLIDEEDKANALLIAAAPELLECLKWTQGMTTEEGWKTFDTWAKRVIAKAKGIA